MDSMYCMCMDSMYAQYHNIHTGLQAIYIQEEGSYIYYIHNGFIQSSMVQLNKINICGRQIMDSKIFMWEERKK